MRTDNRADLIRIAILSLTISVVTAGHFLVGTETHRLHVIHVFLRSLYLLVIIASSVWYGLRGGVGSSLLIATLFGLHVLISWADDPMENVNQMAMIGVYLVLGAVSGLLVHLKTKEREARLETERRAQREAVIQGFAGLSSALKARDEYTREHSENVAELAVKVGIECGLTESQLQDLRLAALVHDIGKIGVRDDILFSENRLSPEEMNAMKQHPAAAAEILRPIKGASRIAEIVLAHHECPDGSGYPRGLRSDEIPEEAKILSVLDVFCALTEKRPYKEGLDSESALEIVHSMAGTELDAEVAMKLEDAIGQVPSTSLSRSPLCEIFKV